MGSYVSIGFVYTNNSVDNIINKLSTLINFFNSKGGKIQNAKVSEDREGNNWIEFNLINNLNFINAVQLLSQYYYGQIDVVTTLFDLKDLELSISIEKNDKEDYFGFIINIPEYLFSINSSSRNVNLYTERFIDLMREYYRLSPYNYAFCDNEAEIIHSPILFENLNKSIYSISIIADKHNNLNVIKSNWNLDGMTVREYF